MLRLEVVEELKRFAFINQSLAALTMLREAVF
jgi:hypothetical protein